MTGLIKAQLWPVLVINIINIQFNYIVSHYKSIRLELYASPSLICKTLVCGS